MNIANLFAAAEQYLRDHLLTPELSEPPRATLARGLANKLGVEIVDADSCVSIARNPQAVASADGAITIAKSTVFITKASAAALTLASPTAGSAESGGHDGVVIEFVSTTAQAHTVTCTAGFGGGTTSRDVATFGGAINDGFAIEAYSGVWYLKPGSRNVTLG